MKRLALVSSIVAVLVAGAAVALQFRPAATAQEERVIRVYAHRDVTDVAGVIPTITEGEACEFPGVTSPEDDPWVVGANQQIIVRDQDDTIVAMAPLTGVIEVPSTATPEPAEDPYLYCEVELDIPLPSESAFYTVWLGDQYLRGYAAADFPLDLSSEFIALVFD